MQFVKHSKFLDMKNKHIVYNPILSLMENSALSTNGHDDSTNGIKDKFILGLQSSNINDNNHKVLLVSSS